MSQVPFLVILLLAGSPLFAQDKILVVTATAGFVHDSIETAEAVIAGIAANRGAFEVSYARTEDEMVSALQQENLEPMKLVLFVNTTGEIAPGTRAELLRWITRGGSFIGVHSAADTWHESPEYIEMLGGEFETHPAETAKPVFVDSMNHPATAALESPFVLFEEFYLFQKFSRERVSMLLSLRSHPGDSTPGFFPLSWHKRYGAGRVFYTALGHRTEVWNSAWFQQHLTGAITWALERDPLKRLRPTRR